MTKDELAELEAYDGISPDDPLVQSLWKAAIGEADPETTAMWKEVGQMMMDIMPSLERYLAPYDVKDHARITQKIMREAFANAFPDGKLPIRD